MSRTSCCRAKIKWRMTNMVRGFRGGEYSECDLQDYDAVQLGTTDISVSVELVDSYFFGDGSSKLRPKFS